MEVLGDNDVDLRHRDAYHRHECDHSLFGEMARSGTALLKAYRLYELVVLFRVKLHSRAYMFDQFN